MKAFNRGGIYVEGPRTFSVEQSDYIEAVVLTAATLTRIPIPAGATVVLFSFNADVWAKFGQVGDSISVPSATSTTGAAPEFNPNSRDIPKGATHVLLISESSAKGSLSFYR